MSVIVKSFVIVMITVVLQLELFSTLRIYDVMPELLVGVTVAAAWTGGSNRGTVMGFFVGLSYDLFLPTPFGLAALAYTIVGYALGVIATAVASTTDRLTRLTFQVSGIAMAIMAYVTIGELLGEPNLYGDRFDQVVIVGTLYTTLFLPALNRAMRWVYRIDAGRDTRMPLHVLQ